MCKYLILLVGPTAVGKTECSIKIAKYFNTEIISCDSRQFYRELVIGTASPDKEQLDKVKHHFVGNKSIYDYYNVNMFESEVLQLLDKIFLSNNKMLMVGGSGLYTNAVCYGIDDIPDVDPQIRKNLIMKFDNESIESLRFELKKLDPDYYMEVDLMNKKRIIRALEVCLSSGKPFSSFRTQVKKTRDFKIIKIGLNMNREDLYNRINLRVDSMIKDGLIEEARKFYKDKGLNTLNTVGYKEIFDYFDGITTLEKAINLIKQNSRHLAKRQLSWFSRDKEIKWFNPVNIYEINDYIQECFV